MSKKKVRFTITLVSYQCVKQVKATNTALSSYQCDLQRPSCGRCVQTGNCCKWIGPDTRMVTFGSPWPGQSSASLRTRVVPGYRTALWTQFQSRYLGSKPGWLSHAFQWVSAMEDLRERTPATKMATTALPLILVGQQQQDQALLQDGLHMYGQALALVARQVQKPQQTARQMVHGLLACLAMFKIEMMYSQPQCGHGWVTHATGMASLLSRSNPSVFQDELHPIFLYCRTAVVSTHHSPSFYSHIYMIPIYMCIY